LSLLALALTWWIWEAVKLELGWRVLSGFIGLITAVVCMAIAAIGGKLATGAASAGLVAAAVMLAATYRLLIAKRLLSIAFDPAPSSISAVAWNPKRMRALINQRRNDPQGKVLRKRLYLTALAQCLVVAILWWAIELPFVFSTAICVPLIVVTGTMWLYMLRDPR
jgi:hypothetical protein